MGWSPALQAGNSGGFNSHTVHWGCPKLTLILGWQPIIKTEWYGYYLANSCAGSNPDGSTWLYRIFLVVRKFKV